MDYSPWGRKESDMFFLGQYTHLGHISSKYAYVNVHRLKKNPSATERTQAVHLEFGVYMPPLSTCHVTLDKLRTYITLPEPQGPHLPQL